jgi:hypothetical protein
MKIKLIRTGGFIPVTKAAETEVTITEIEMKSLLEVIRSDSSAYRVKDGNYYHLTIGSKSTPVDLDKVPEEYKDVFSRLKSNLKIVK